MLLGATVRYNAIKPAKAVAPTVLMLELICNGNILILS